VEPVVWRGLGPIAVRIVLFDMAEHVFAGRKHLSASALPRYDRSLPHDLGGFVAIVGFVFLIR